MFLFLLAQRSAGDLLCSIARTPREFGAAPSPQEFRATPAFSELSKRPGIMSGVKCLRIAARDGGDIR